MNKRQHKKKNIRKRNPGLKKVPSITNVIVGGYKSVNNLTSISIKPLTVLAGTNSSGKSSFIQPLLLMKQTIEEGFDPGALLLNGPHVKFTSVDQILHTNVQGKKREKFTVGFVIDNEDTCEITYSKNKNGFIIEKAFYKTTFYDENYNQTIKEITLDKETDTSTLLDKLPDYIKKVFTSFVDEDVTAKISRDRCFFNVNISFSGASFSIWEYPQNTFKAPLRNIIHLPGLRGNPERNYPTTAIDSDFESTYLPGNFEKYVASLINKWQLGDKKQLLRLEKYLKMLGLTNKVRTEKINDTQVAINVGRGLLVENEATDLVNIADVGLGVSQTLPVLVALVYAKPGQMVYVEQPEIHLHPRAQYALAEILGEAVLKGVRIVIETHSSLIIKGVQTAVARNKINKEDVNLHWFSRNKESGETQIESAVLNSDGSFGDWPIDFDEVEITAEMNYLYAAEDNINE
ncbi:AAA family ATPase [Neobacillus sp. LXY-4]|uniref:AAA family ATPase n=1 Tax=Neobacillus sp. LXY-4 TaxID=3379826 RepID=UPI003EE31B39